MHPRRAAKLAAIAHAHGQPFWQLVASLAAQGLSRRQAAQRLGYDWSGFCRLLSSPEAPAIHWAAGDHGARTRQGLRRAGRPQIVAVHNGRELTVEQAAEVAGVAPSTIRWRWRNNWRGERLLAPARNGTKITTRN